MKRRDGGGGLYSGLKLVQYSSRATRVRETFSVATLLDFYGKFAKFDLTFEVQIPVLLLDPYT